MELSKRIKELRTEKGWSQETLAERAYVSRQTISNWETEKSYPDVHSLLILCDVFGVSLDELIKGDVDTMKETIKNDEARKLKKLWNLCGIEFLAALTFLLLAILLKTEEIKLLCAFIAGAFMAVDFITMIKMEQIKKDNDVQTYREVIAFMNGETLDDIEKQKELAKRLKDIKFRNIIIGFCAASLVVAVLLLINYFVIAN
jgi:transcriptional regulator with XRE-family HTH domain